jgi:hypothetical protein
LLEVAVLVVQPREQDQVAVVLEGSAPELRCPSPLAPNTPLLWALAAHRLLTTQTETPVIPQPLALLHRLAVVLVTAVHRLSRVVLADQVAAVVTPGQAALEILQTLRHLKEVTVEMARESRGQIMVAVAAVARLQLAAMAATLLAATAATELRLAFLDRL